jgi:hypothetical protein
VLDKISTAIPLKITANLVQEQQYWERCCKARWEICDVSQYGSNHIQIKLNVITVLSHHCASNIDDQNKAIYIYLYYFTIVCCFSVQSVDL